MESVMTEIVLRAVASLKEAEGRLIAGGTVYPACELCLQCFDAVGWAAGRASGL